MLSFSGKFLLFSASLHSLRRIQKSSASVATAIVHSVTSSYHFGEDIQILTFLGSQVAMAPCKLTKPILKLFFLMVFYNSVTNFVLNELGDGWMVDVAWIRQTSSKSVLYVLKILLPFSSQCAWC